MISPEAHAHRRRRVTGAPGTGKSVNLRMLAEPLGNQRDVKVGMVTRPQPISLTSIARWVICSASIGTKLP